MKFGDDLGKSRRARWIVTMTERALVSASRRYGCELVRLLNVLRRGTVTDLAGQTPVVGLTLGFVNVVVTLDADIVPRVGDLLRHYLLDGSGTIVPKFTECVRNEELPRHDQRGDRHCEDDRQWDELLWNSRCVQPSSGSHSRNGSELNGQKKSSIIVKVNT
jgi:hypothetical protein